MIRYLQKSKNSIQRPILIPTDIKFYTLSEVAQHDSSTDLWMIIHDKVYDITNFIDSHPGGAEVLFECAGLDATEAFDEVGHSQYSIDMLQPLFKGLLRKDKLQDINENNDDQINENILKNQDDGIVRLRSNSKKTKTKIENVSIGESNWKERKHRKKRLKETHVIPLLTLLALFAMIFYIYLQSIKLET